jgi:hypothetical protein
MSSKRVSGKRNSLQRVHHEVRWLADEPAQLYVELAPPEAYPMATSVPQTPSWRDGTAEGETKRRHEAGEPFVVSVIEIDLM